VLDEAESHARLWALLEDMRFILTKMRA